MDDNTIRVAVGLRLGSTLCRPHTCQHCGADVNHLATHGLSSKKKVKGATIDMQPSTRFYTGYWHQRASHASRLEPSGLDNHDPMEEWQAASMGYNMPRHSRHVLLLLCHQWCWSSGYLGGREEVSQIYPIVGPSHSFTPVGIETLGAIRKKSLAFLKELSQKVWQHTGEVKARTYLLQHLSVSVQRGNSVCGRICGVPFRIGPVLCVNVYVLSCVLIFVS